MWEPELRRGRERAIAQAQCATIKCMTKGKIDFEQAEKLAALNCTAEEIAAFFKYTQRAVEKRLTEDPKFRECIDRGRSLGRLSVRRAQFRLLDAGNATMGIWLGKQLLGQRDFAAVEFTGANAGPIEQRVTIRYVRVDDRSTGITPRTIEGNPIGPEV